MTTINTIVKATPSTLSVSVKTQEARTFEINNPLKGVVGQLAKLGDLIEKVIFRGDYSPEDFEFGETQLEEVVEMETPKFNFKDLPFKEASNINCLLQVVGGKTFPESLGDIEDSILKVSWNEDEKVQLALRELESIVKGLYPTKEVVNNYPLVVYTGPVVLPTVIQLGVVYSEVGVETDQGVKTSKFLCTNTGIITYKGTRFESVEALVNAVKAAFKVETQEVSEATQTQPEEVQMKPKTFCQLLKEEWLLTQEEWVVSTLHKKLVTTWKSGKYPTDARQGEFMKRFFEKLAVYSEDTVLPVHAFISTYDLVKEELTGSKIQPEQKPFVSSMTPEEAAANFEGEHKVEIVTQTITKKFEPIPLPAHLKKCGEVRELPKVDTRSYSETLQDMAEKSVFTLINEDWDMTDLKNLEEFVLTPPGEQPELVVIDEKEVYLDDGVCQAIRQACMHLMSENLKGGSDFKVGKYTDTYSIYEKEFWLAKANSRLDGYYLENYVKDRDTGDVTVDIIRENYRTTPAGDTARAFLGTLGLVTPEVVHSWGTGYINTPYEAQSQAEITSNTAECFEFGLIW